MTIRSKLVACLLLWFTAHAVADAPDTLETAAAEMHTKVFAASGMLRKCAEAAPKSSAVFHADMASWQRRDAKAIQRAEEIWRDMEATVPQTAEERVQDALEFDRLWATVTDVPGGNAAAVIEQRCTRYFFALANGVWRTRRPEIYRLLER